jgi:CheY-like chemotaxis protein
VIRPEDISVLVVDDHAANRYAVSRGLRAAGFKTVEAASGAEALDLAQYVSAVVLDVHLPDVHGLEVCRLLRARPSTAALPIVHVSAVYVTEQDRLAGEAAGADAYLTTPVAPETLVRTVSEVIAARQRS